MLKRALPAAMPLCALFTAACGGGGSGGVNSTPTPLPTSTPNTSLLNLTDSEDFTNDTATGKASYNKLNGVLTGGAAQSQAVVRYDKNANSYTIMVDGRSKTFSPSDRDAAQSGAAIDVYVKKSGSTTDSLTLTKAGTSGRFHYQYVGGGFWQQTTDRPQTLSGSFDAFAYGVESANSAVPRSGRGNYVVDLLGAMTIPNDVVGITGEGAMDIDFSSGTIVTQGNFTSASPFAFGEFYSLAKLSSSLNSFSGGFGIGGLDGQMSGRLFGPDAQEIGAAFHATNGTYVAAGAIVGRERGTTVSNETISNMSVNEFFNGDRARLSFNAAAGAGPVTVTDHGVGDVLVHYDALTGARRYNFIAPDRQGRYQFADYREAGLTNFWFAGVSPEMNAGDNRYLIFFAEQKYLKTGRWYQIDGNKYVFDDFVFGIDTAASAMPRTGQGGYDVGLRASVAKNGVNDVDTISGNGTLTVDFASGSLNTQGVLQKYFGYPDKIGSFSGNATISSNSNKFAGTLSFNGVGAFSGDWRGRFFGPETQEIGSVFSLTSSDGSVAHGSLSGARDATILAARQGLNELTETTTLKGAILARGASFYLGDAVVTFDPVARTYSFVDPAYVGSGSPLSLTLASGDIDAARSDATFTAYQKGDTKARLFNPGAGNPKLNLTYTSFADMTVVTPGTGETTQYYVPFGIETPLSQMPRAGSAGYAGIVYGQGFVRGVSNNALIGGTSAIHVDFSSNDITATLALNARDPLSSASSSLGDFAFAGRMSAPGFSNTTFFIQSTDNRIFSGNLFGGFYGQNAAEIGARFNIDKSDGFNTEAYVWGVTLAKKIP